jgi:hypothetical protein
MLKNHERMELIEQFIKTGKQPQGYRITVHGDNYRVWIDKPKIDLCEELEMKKVKYEEKLKTIKNRLQELNDNKTNQSRKEPRDNKVSKGYT